MNEPLKKSLAAKSAGICKVKATRTAEETIVAAVEKPTKKSTAKAISNTATITAAPRRRVKVTLLAAPVVEEVESAPTEITAPEKATRAKKTAAKAESSSKLESAPKPRTKKNLTEITKDETKATPKPRGRPKKAVLEVSESKLESNNPTDTTVLKTTALPKKKVTFQELPEDDKENQPAPNKRVGGKKESLTTTGLRARPVRKPVTAATCKRTTAGKIETLPPRALTPKKITQVARSSTPVDSDEDELNGGKTPVRDLSQSPKRNIP
jgi:hypothetical protein